MRSCIKHTLVKYVVIVSGAMISGSAAGLFIWNCWLIRKERRTYIDKIRELNTAIKELKCAQP